MTRPRSSSSLDYEKLRLEILELNRPWWKKPTYIAAIFPSILALGTLIYGFANGYFQASFVKLDTQTMLLKADKEKLEADIKSITGEKQILEERKEKLAAKVTEVENLLRSQSGLSSDNSIAASSRPVTGLRLGKPSRKQRQDDEIKLKLLDELKKQILVVWKEPKPTPPPAD